VASCSAASRTRSQELARRCCAAVLRILDPTSARRPGRGALARGAGAEGEARC
jgi:hypothetical protein